MLGFSASILHRTGNLLGVANGLALVAACLMMLAGAYDNCFCSSTIFTGGGDRVYFDETANLKSVYKFCIGSTFMAISSSMLYSAGIYLASPMIG
jgi:hypothetical protein